MLASFKIYNQPHHEDEPGTGLRIAIALSTLFVIILAIGAFVGTRQYKAGNALELATNTQVYFCSVLPGESEIGAVVDYRNRGREKLAEWQAYIEELGLTGLINKGLNFSAGEAVIRQKCVGVTQVFIQAQASVTESEKIAAYNAVKDYRERAIDEANNLMDFVYSRGISAIETFANAVAFESTRQSSDSSRLHMQNARDALANGDMDLVIAYANKALEVFVTLPVLTPAPTQIP